jgi:vanillate/3-O-methylgallate O-demethylase
MFSGISYNERSMLSLGVVDPDIQIGDDLMLVWGEENGGTGKRPPSNATSRSRSA